MTATLLVIDDEEGMRYTLKRFLADEGHRVFTAKSYDEAMAVMSEADLDVIVSDIVLAGGKTGIDVLRTARETSPRCPVVMITGYPDIETAAEAVRLGAFDYVSKPVVQDTLLRTVGKALRHKTAVDTCERYRSNLEAVFRSVRDAIISVDPALRIIELNESAQTICSLSRGAVGLPLDTAGLRCGGKCLESLRKAIQARQMVRNHRIECAHAEHGAQWVSLCVFPLFDHSNAFSGAVMVVKDETGRVDPTLSLTRRSSFGSMVGVSDGMQKTYDLVESLQNVQTTVLILGESGTGKELVAEALHNGGDRCRKPFVKMNCGALSDNLLESELFGHVKGAFTGAVADKTGRFQRADGGSIFLDEIGNISPRMQLSLLRVLQERELERVGDSRPIGVDVRVIAATNQDLLEKMRRGEFREDLYYRLKVVQVTIPPLRDRPEDIPLLVEHFRKKLNHKLKREIAGFAQDVQEIFSAYPWPGNVRELENAIEHGFIMCRGATITRAHLPSELLEFLGSPGSTSGIAPALPGKDNSGAIRTALQQAGWNKAKAASMLGISKRTIFRKIREYDITDHRTQEPA
jgi:two-component system, NtrC family, response regulator HydG